MLLSKRSCNINALFHNCFERIKFMSRRPKGLAYIQLLLHLFIGPNISEHVINGKAYKRAMRTHNITLQALWKLLLPLLFKFYQTSYPNLYQEIPAFVYSTESAEELTTSLKSSVGQDTFDDFVKQKSEKNVNFLFWWSYMEMVSILLMFTRA